MGFVLDKSFASTLEKKVTIRPADLPHGSAAVKGYVKSAGDLALIADIASSARKAIAEPGRLQTKYFERYFFRDIEHYSDDRDYPHMYGQSMIDIAFYALNSVCWQMEEEVHKAIQSAFKQDAEIDLDGLLEKRNRVRALLDILELVRSAPRNERGTIDAAKCVKKDGEVVLQLKWRRRLSKDIIQYPCLMLDATANEELAKLPLAERDWDGDSPGEAHFVTVKLHMPHQYLVKVLDAPYQKSKFTNVALKRGKLTDEEQAAGTRARLNLVKMRSDAGWATIFRVVEAISGRALANGGTVGFITYDLVEKYLKQHRPMPEGIPVGHFGKIRGSNAWENCSALIIAGRNLMPMEELEEEAASIFALDPAGRAVRFGAGMQTLERGLRVAGSENGVACLTEVPACPLVRLVYEDTVVAEEAQALGRARGARRGADNPVLVISINNVVADVTFDAVVRWEAFAGLCERGAALHAHGVVPDKPEDLRALIPNMFSEGVEARNAARAMSRRTARDENKRNRAKHLQEDTNISVWPGFDGISSRSPRHAPTSLQFNGDTVLFGTPAAHPLVAPALPGISSYRPARASRGCWVDLERTQTASATLRRIAGVGLAEDEIPKPARPRGRPGSGKSRAERAREYRARRKASRP